VKSSARSLLPLAVAFGCGVAVATFGGRSSQLGAGESSSAASVFSGTTTSRNTDSRNVRGIPQKNDKPTSAAIDTSTLSTFDELVTGANRRRTQSATCSNDFSHDAGPGSPWDRLSSFEESIVKTGLRSALKLNLYDSDPFQADSVRSVDLDDPPKAEMLEYLDKGGPKPERYARAWVMHLQGEADHIMEYRVGPIDASAGTYGTVTALTKEGSIPGSAYKLTWSQQSAAKKVIKSFAGHPSVSEFLTQAFGSTSTIEHSFHENDYDADASRYVNVAYRRRTSLLDNILAYPLPFEFRVDMEPANDSSQWRIVNVLYRHEYFATSLDFIDALQKGEVTIQPTLPFSSNPFWQTLDGRTTDRPDNDLPPAVNVQPAKRYTVVGGQVEWLGWSFHVKNRARTAMIIHDVRFMGARIAYEMSLQELQAIYTGRQPYMANKYLFDSVFNYGSLNRQLKAGVDCPVEATYFDNICVFEHDAGIPLWRKDHQGNKFYAGAKNTKLVVRSVFPVGNYDYLVEAKFNPDGAIDMGFAATGQLFMSHYDKSEEAFGTKVHDEALANVHAHFAAFKVDLDILGQKNCVEKTEVKYGPRADIPGTENDNPNLHVPEKNMYINRVFVDTEDEALVKVNNQAPVQWKVASCSEKNTWGYHRGYDILHPNTPLAISDEPSFNDYHMIFAKRKEDTEEYLTTPVDFLSINEPVLSVTNIDRTVDGSEAQGISNGESLKETDVVTWISVGFYHVPRVEDNPVTNIVESHFRLQPSNYFDENPSIDLGQTDRYRNGKKQESTPAAGCSVEL